MTNNDLIQFGLFVAGLFLMTKPVGLYLQRVLSAEGKTFLDPVMGPIERLFYRLLKVDPEREQDWRQYTMSLLCFSLVGALFTYAVLRLQHFAPLNPQELGPVADHLSLNTAVSFTTNTNWQSYSGESTLSYFSQMAGLTFHNFISAAVGISVAAALVRGIAAYSSRTIGNFWVDVVRISLYLLVPLSILIAVFMVSQGMIQNFNPYVVASVVDKAETDPSSRGSDGSVSNGGMIKPDLALPGANTQVIAQGPVASQVAIKLLGTNGGGFMNANAAHPYENPTPLTNFIQMLIILMIPSGLTYYFGSMVKNQGHGWSVWATMFLLFVIAAAVCIWAEYSGNPLIKALGVDATQGNMEGKEVRFGTFNSALFAVVTTVASCGAVNSMHDSFTPLGGLVPLLNIQLGEVIYGGVGSGLYGMLVFVVLTVFLSGLMIGRTPEYLGKKIEAFDVKMGVLFVMVPVITILGFAAWAAISDWGLAGLGNQGPHGLTEIVYAYSSATGNNGSAFAGLNSNTPGYNVSLAAAMLLGRFFMIIPVMALAGSMAKKKIIPAGPGSFPVSGVTFTMLLASTVLIVGALTFFPVLSLGAIVEHLIMGAGGKLY